MFDALIWLWMKIDKNLLVKMWFLVVSRVLVGSYRWMWTL